MGMGFLFDAVKAWLGKKSADKQARSAYDSRYTNNPRWALRNQLLTQLWREHNLGDRFKDAFPAQGSVPGQSTKTPENVLIGLTTPPRYEGRPGTGFDFASTLLQLGGNAAMQAAAAGAGGGGGLPIPSGGFPMPPGGVSVNSQGDPLDPFALTLPTTIPFNPRPPRTY